MATLVASCRQGVESRSCQSKREGTFMRWTPEGSSVGFSKIRQAVHVVPHLQDHL